MCVYQVGPSQVLSNLSPKIAGPKKFCPGPALRLLIKINALHFGLFLRVGLGWVPSSQGQMESPTQYQLNQMQNFQRTQGMVGYTAHLQKTSTFPFFQEKLCLVVICAQKKSLIVMLFQMYVRSKEIPRVTENPLQPNVPLISKVFLGLFIA